MKQQIGVLVVDDDRLITATLVSGLQDAGYAAFGAQSAEEARALVRRVAVDIVVVDSKMPDESGARFAEWLRTETDLPFLFLSAYSDTETVHAAIQAGALAYLVKPVQVSQLIPMLEAVRERATEIATLRAHEHKLERAVSTNREISVAVGLTMARHGLLKEEAYRVLRRQARANRQKLEELARALINADELLSSVARTKA